MNDTTQNTKELMQRMRPRIDAALEQIAAEFGLETLRLGNGTYTSGGAFTFKLNGLVEGGKTKEAANYEIARKYESGLPPLGFRFMVGRVEHTVVGMLKSGNVLTKTKTGNYSNPVAFIKAQYARRQDSLEAA